MPPARVVFYSDPSASALLLSQSGLNVLGAVSGRSTTVGVGVGRTKGRFCSWRA
ncbi:MAG: hypothetical protein ACRDZQ_06870 [Acidimicrobiales bacterium]